MAAETDDRPDPTPDEQAAIDADEIVQAVADLDRQDILLLRALAPLLQELRFVAEDRELERSNHAARCALTAISERIGRICRRDVPVDQALLG